MNKLFDVRDLDGILKEASLKLSDKTFKDVVASKLKQCSKNPTLHYLIFLQGIFLHFLVIKNAKHHLIH